MKVLFYISAIIAVAATIMVVTRRNAVHAVLYLIISLFASALIFWTFGAPYAAALEVIVYAGAIMVLFVFIIILLNPSEKGTVQEKLGLTRADIVFPSILVSVLLVQMVLAIVFGIHDSSDGNEVGPKEVGISLFGPYLLGVELASLLLLAGLIGAYHLGRSTNKEDGSS